jgi:hypothetical protein
MEGKPDGQRRVDFAFPADILRDEISPPLFEPAGSSVRTMPSRVPRPYIYRDTINIDR